MHDLKYYLLTWNGNKSFELILSDGSYQKEPEDDRWRYEGKVFGSVGGWDSALNKFVTPKILDKPRYEYMFDPESYRQREGDHSKQEMFRKTIQFIFEEFRPD